MKILKPVDTISTDNLLMSLERSVAIAFCFGFFGGMSLVFLSMAKGITQDAKGVIAGLDAIALLLFLFLADRYARNTIIPEIQKRCRQSGEETVATDKS
jgi:hypothetical protein